MAAADWVCDWIVADGKGSVVRLLGWGIERDKANGDVVMRRHWLLSNLRSDRCNMPIRKVV